tara:strand:+ start:357 stop:575 length:219 start_codon:yes stop_codon:yes gene_type:complete
VESISQPTKLDNLAQIQDVEGPISIEEISILTDFPEDFIKKELLLDGVSEITMSDFRKKVLEYLERSMDLVG